MDWDKVIEKVRPYIVKIETPSGSGTGYLCAWNESKQFCGIATAFHVVADADEWQQPIRLHNHDFSKTQFLKESDRVVFSDPASDSAVLFFPKSNLELPESLIRLRPIDSPLGLGAEIGWLGYPALEPYTLCFFSGSISARREDRSAYLIDGVAINGVSGGPVVYSSQSDGAQFVGAVSAYRANRLSGEALPGLLVAQDVTHFHDVIQRIQDWDEALAKRKQIESEQEKPKESATGNPP